MSFHPRHRHFVALPILLLLVVASVTSASPHSLLGALSWQAANGELRFPDGGVAVVERSGAVDQLRDIPVLLQGTALFVSQGITRVKAQTLSLVGMAGAFFVSVNDDVVTVASITSPVLLFSGERVAIVPVGYQLRIGEGQMGADAGEVTSALVPLPARFLKDQMLRASRVHFDEASLPPILRTLPTPDPTVPGLRLPAALGRAQETQRLQILGALRSRLEEDDEEGARAILLHSQYRGALTARRSLSSLVALATRLPHLSSGLRTLLLSPLASSRDLWFLGSFHPELRHALWSLSLPILSSEEHLLLAFTLPISDHLPEGLSPVVLAWWKNDVAATIGAQREPLVLANRLLALHLPTVKTYLDEGYPERAQILAHALQSFADPLRQRLPSPIVDQLAKAQKIASHDLQLFPVEEEAHAAATVPVQRRHPAAARSTSSSAEILNPAALVRATAAVLERNQAIFSVETTIMPVDVRRVRVSGIVIASSREDHIYDFEFDALAAMVSSIVRDGQKLPYAMSLNSFLAWARR